MSCIFCQIIEGSIPATVRWQNEQWIAIDDIHPKADTHILLMSRKHIPSLKESAPQDDALLATTVSTLRHLAKEVGVEQAGYRIVNNCGKDAGQLVDHLHFHLMSGKLNM